MRNKLYVGEVVQYSITYQDTKLLERDDTQNIQVEKCSQDSYDECLYKKVNRYMRKHTRDNCTVPWIPNNENICTGLEDIKTSYFLWRNVVENDFGQCYIPCHLVSVIVDAKDNHETSDMNSSYSVSTFYFPPVVTKNVEHEIYDTVRVFAEVGGYLNLFLGYSLFGTVLGLISYISNKIESVSWQKY